MTGHRVAERPRRHTGEIVDAIWEAELPAVMDERDERAAAVAEPVARLVLMAMARFTNPTRDQVYGPTREWRCWASVATIAELAGASERQVQRVLRVFEREHYIDRVDQGRRPGRPRKGEEPGQARPSTWCLRPDQWRQRPMKNRTGVVAISNDRRKSLPVPEEVPSTPVGLPGNGTGTGREVAEIVPVSSPEPGTTGTLNGSEQKNKPAHAAARADDVSSIDEPKTNDHVRGHQVALPLTGAVGLVSPEPAPATPPPAVDALAEGKRMWESARHQMLRPGAGVEPALITRVRNTAAAGYSAAAGVLTLDGDLVAEDLEPGSTVAAAVASAARGRRLELRLIGGAPASHLPAGMPARAAQPAEATGGERSNDDAAIRARLRSKLSTEELALLDELERQRVSYAEGPVVPAADDQVEQVRGNVESDVAETEQLHEAPRRRRKKEHAVA